MLTIKKLIQAFVKSNASCVEPLILNAIDEEGRNLLFHCIDEGNLVLFTYLLNNQLSHAVDLNCCDYDGVSLVSYSLVKKRPEFTFLLLRRPVDVNIRDDFGWNALMYSVSESTEIFRAVFDSTLTPDLSITKDGWTPLVRAIAFNNASIVKTLTSSGSRLDTRCLYGRTALLNAAYWGTREIFLLLIEAGADVLEKDTQGWSALFYAVYCGHTSIVKDLLDTGIMNLSDRDTYGRTVLDYANSEGIVDIVGVLSKALNDSCYKR